MQVPSFRKTLPQQRYQWRTSVTTIMGWEWGPQRYNIRIMTVLSPYHTWGEVLNFCQIASESRGMCHVCERTSYTRGHGGRRVWKQPLWSCWRERVSAPSQTETVKSFGFFFLIKKCNQSMFNPTWQRGRWRWMLLLGGAPVVWGVQGHSPSWARLLHSLCPVAASTWQWKLQQQFNSIERSIQGLTLKQTHAKWAPQMCTTISKRTDLRVHASHYKHR